MQVKYGERDDHATTVLVPQPERGCLTTEILNLGDHIVHLDYGIGINRGTTILKVGAEESESSAWNSPS